MDFSSWKWNPHYDLDLAQRCLFILGFTWVSNWVLQVTLLNYLFGDYLVHLIATIALLMAMVKSSLQLSPKGKSVLVTGKSHMPCIAQMDNNSSSNNVTVIIHIVYKYE